MKCPRCQEESEFLSESGYCHDCEDFLMEMAEIEADSIAAEDVYAKMQAQDDTGHRRSNHEA